MILQACYGAIAGVLVGVLLERPLLMTVPLGVAVWVVLPLVGA